MKIYTKDIPIQTDKNVKSKRIACFSDLHFSKTTDIKLLTELYNKIASLNADYICFMGDLLNDPSYDEVYKFIQYLSYLAPVIMIDGNHDIEKFMDNDEFHYNSFYASEDFKMALKEISGVNYLQNNDSLTLDGITFIGTNFYHLSHEREYQGFLDHNLPKIRPENYNVFLCHNPGLVTPDILEKVDPLYQNIDLALTGHIHNALMPAYLDQHIKGNLGIYTKDTGFFPTDFIGEKEIIVNGKKIYRVNIPAITTLPYKGFIPRNLNKLYPPSIRLVRIKKD